MINAVCGMLRNVQFRPLSQGIAHTPLRTFFSPPHVNPPHNLKRRDIVPYESGNYTVPNPNFSADGETKMDQALEFLKNSVFQKVRFERGALICRDAWIKALLDHLKLKLTTPQIELIILSKHTDTPLRLKWVNPAVSEIREFTSQFGIRPKRPWQSIITEINLATKGMIPALSALMSDASHAAGYELSTKEPPTSG